MKNWRTNGLGISLVTVKKPSGILRLCLDPHHLNQAIKWPQHTAQGHRSGIGKISDMEGGLKQNGSLHQIGASLTKCPAKIFICVLPLFSVVWFSTCCLLQMNLNKWYDEIHAFVWTVRVSIRSLLVSEGHSWTECQFNYTSTNEQISKQKTISIFNWKGLNEQHYY